MIDVIHNNNGLIYEHLSKMKHMQKKILRYIENEDQDGIIELNNYFVNQQIFANKSKLKETLHMISKISENHYRGPNFNNKIDNILNLFHFKEQNFFSNYEIFMIFRNSKRILLYLFENGILIPDQSINQIIKSKYKNSFYFEYLFEEFKSNLDKESFKEKRQIGENSFQMCQMIQKDMIDDFVVYVNKENLSLNKEVTPSIYETNNFLIKNKPTLIEYAAFYGSIQIFNYLRLNKAKLRPSLWLYAIHGNTPDLIHILEESRVDPPRIDEFERKSKATLDYINEEPYFLCFKEAIKCHHNDIAKYIKENLFKNQNFAINLSIFCKNFNYEYIQDDLIIEDNVQIFAKYDFMLFVEFFLKESKIYVNKTFKSIKYNAFEYNFISKIFNWIPNSYFFNIVYD